MNTKYRNTRYKVICKQMCTNFWSINIWFFTCTESEKPVKVDDVTLNAASSVSNCCTSKMTLFKFLDKTRHDKNAFGKNIEYLISKFDDLASYFYFLLSNLKKNISDEFHFPIPHMCHMTWVQLFIRRRLTWPWPSLVSIGPILIWCLSQPLRSILAKFGFAAVIIPVPLIDKANKGDFDLWPGLGLFVSC